MAFSAYASNTNRVLGGGEMFFTDYMKAVIAAQRLANESQQRVAIRLEHLSNKPRFSVRLWKQGDACRAEVIHPQREVA